MNRLFTIENIVLFVIVAFLINSVIPDVASKTGLGETVQDTGDIRNLKTCIEDMKLTYTTRRVENSDSIACNMLKCFSVDLGENEKDGIINIKGSDTADASCFEEGGVYDQAEAKGLVDAPDDTKEYKLDGRINSIKY